MPVGEMKSEERYMYVYAYGKKGSIFWHRPNRQIYTRLVHSHTHTHSTAYHDITEIPSGKTPATFGLIHTVPARTSNAIKFGVVSAGSYALPQMVIRVVAYIFYVSQQQLHQHPTAAVAITLHNLDLCSVCNVREFVICQNGINIIRTGTRPTRCGDVEEWNKKTSNTPNQRMFRVHNIHCLAVYSEHDTTSTYICIAKVECEMFPAVVAAISFFSRVDARDVLVTIDRLHQSIIGHTYTHERFLKNRNSRIR